jgi:hypothetical protein
VPKFGKARGDGAGGVDKGGVDNWSARVGTGAAIRARHVPELRRKDVKLESTHPVRRYGTYRQPIQ